MSNKSKYIKLGKNTLLLTIGSFSSKILSYFLVPLYTSVLSTSQYGEADLVTTTVSLILPIFSMQISEAVMRFLLNKKKQASVLVTGLVALIGGMLVFLVFSPLFLLFSNVSKYYWLFVLTMIGEMLFIFAGQYAKGIEQVGIFTVAGIINTGTTIGFNILCLIVFKLGVVGYLLSYVMGYFCGFGYLFCAGKMYKNVLERRLFDKYLLRDMLAYSIPLIPNAICWWVNNSSDKYLVSFFCGNSALGVYSIAYKIPSLLSMIMTIFFSAWQISSVENFGSEASKKFYSDVFDKLMLLSICTSIFLISVSEIIGKIMYANDYYIAWKYTIILVVAYLFNSLATFFGSIYTAAMETKVIFMTSVLSAVINIIANFCLIPLWGVAGAAIATVLCYVVVFVIRLFHSKTILSFYVNYRGLFTSLIILVTCAFISFFQLPYSRFFCFGMVIIYSVLFLRKVYKMLRFT